MLQVCDRVKGCGRGMALSYYRGVVSLQEMLQLCGHVTRLWGVVMIKGCGPDTGVYS